MTTPASPTQLAEVEAENKSDTILEEKISDELFEEFANKGWLAFKPEPTVLPKPPPPNDGKLYIWDETIENWVAVKSENDLTTEENLENEPEDTPQLVEVEPENKSDTVLEEEPNTVMEKILLRKKLDLKKYRI